MKAVGVDLGGHKIAAALVEDGHILRRISEPTS
ncbi:MAG: ROK family protein, partial [Synergistales bacterium]|nr:ROK family protein [Synergistales bacterium]